MRTKNIDLTFKMKDEMGSYNMVETLVVGIDTAMTEVEEMLKNTYNKEIILMSYSENIAA